jgi:UDP-3-O-[3-hydroxymyristoyl] N-acetylglucosamine deacetylase / 3-hydroxyacyl-[acyl-carrier-protein] dehydratase
MLWLVWQECKSIEEQEALRNYYVVKEIINYTDVEKGIDIKIYPDDHYNLDVLISYPSNVLSNQFASLKSINDFEEEISGCKTFVFLHELEFLLKNNLIKGGDLNNALVIVDREVSQDELDRLADLFQKPRVQVKDKSYLNNTELLFDNEPARHKLLDLVGDLALLGMPIKGKVIASRPGHGANTELAKIIKALIKKDKNKPSAPAYNPNQEPLYDIKKIMKVLPHRPPFLLIDKITELEENFVVGIKSVTMNEPFFVGHFPGEPVMPGVLQVEAMAQTGGILVLNTVPDPENYITYFLKIDKVKFRKSVVPGDTVIFKCDLIAPIRRGVATMYGQAFVGDTVVMEAEMMAQIVKTQ